MYQHSHNVALTKLIENVSDESNVSNVEDDREDRNIFTCCFTRLSPKVSWDSGPHATLKGWEV